MARVALVTHRLEAGTGMVRPYIRRLHPLVAVLALFRQNKNTDICIVYRSYPLERIILSAFLLPKYILESGYAVAD
jgi:hypothetical protein